MSLNWDENNHATDAGGNLFKIREQDGDHWLLDMELANQKVRDGVLEARTEPGLKDWLDQPGNADHAVTKADSMPEPEPE